MIDLFSAGKDPDIKLMARMFLST